jgi:hypothetical protein
MFHGRPVGSTTHHDRYQWSVRHSANKTIPIEEGKPYPLGY